MLNLPPCSAEPLLLLHCMEAHPGLLLTNSLCMAEGFPMRQ